MRYLLAFTLAWLSMASVSTGQVFFEDFEDSTVGYTTSVPDDLSDIAARDYFGRIAPDTASPPADVMYSNLQGSGYYGAQDTDGATSGNIDVINLEIFGLNVSQYENLDFSFYVAEDTAGDGNEDWDTTSSLSVEYQLDGGGFVSLLAIESELGTDGNETNEAPRLDTDFDGTGDGLAITDAFTQFAFSIPNGSLLDLRFRITDLDTGDEDIAIDSISVTGDFVGIPEPGTFGLLLVAGTTGFIRRRR